MRVDVIVDLAPEAPGHAASVSALREAATAAGIEATVRVVRTDTIDDRYLADLPAGVMVGPGTPYASPPAAERVIATARERGIPLVAT